MLSCALALLAANPVALRAVQESPVPLTRVAGSLPAQTPIIVETTPADVTIPATPARTENRRAKPGAKVPTREHSAILQTVALLNAVLIQHLAPLTTQAILAPDANAAMALHPSQPQSASATRQAAVPQPYQQTFSLKHCLLAPPV